MRNAQRIPTNVDFRSLFEPASRVLAHLAIWSVVLLAAIVTLTFSGRVFGAGGPQRFVGPASASDQARFNRATPPPGLAVARQKPVSVDLDSLDPASGTPPSQLTIELFDGQSVTLNVDRIDRRGAGNFTWHGKIQGHPQGRASFTVVGGDISGIVELGDTGKARGRNYKVQSNRDGLKVLEELDTSAFPPDHPPGAGDPVAPVTPKRSAVDASGALSFGSAPDAFDIKADSAATIDVLVVYSNQTAAAAGSAIAAQIQQAIDTANTVYANSGVSTRLRLVQSQQVSYNESGDFATDLSWLTSNGSIASLRTTYGADVVSMIIENGQYCGYGYVGPSAGYAFSVVNRGCSSSNYSLVHEIGHNFGALHDAYVDPSSTPYAYGHGYVNCAGAWRDVMAYPTQCGGTRIPYLSNPNIAYGSPAYPLGTTSTANVAKVHNDNAYTVANFRAASSGGGAGGTACAYAVSPGSASIGSGSNSGSFSVTAASGCSWGATSNTSWLAIGAGSGTAGTGTLQYTASANAGPARSGSINIGGQATFSVSQSSGCSYALSPASATAEATGSSGSTALATSSGCSWTASSSASWLSVSPSSGSGNASVSYSVAANTGTTTRSANLTIGGTTFLVTQSPSSSGNAPTGTPKAALAPSSVSFGGVVLGSTSGIKSAQVSNTGSAALTIKSLTAGGANAADFTRSGSCAASLSLAPGQSCSLQYTLRPTSMGSKVANLAVATTGGSVTLTLSGSGKKGGRKAGATGGSGLLMAQ